MKKIEGSENALLTFGILVPVGTLGALFCLLVFVIMSIFNLLIFLFLLLCGICSLTYGYLSRIVGGRGLVHAEDKMPNRDLPGDVFFQDPLV
jgi:hypothetical protein